ncbi:endonuclease/exonuclease/phosphatase family protein [Neptunicoccus sediminis]|uniref:endonuclease/exonuclease/phosphatase family protein n=1 Tax=Neptunicoccus sediminis TaxID=1892596 RepID=UPI000845E2DA|nr:endonuclease/exonuclease/phosphatase family protein [Neptunicoccus sediminis]
MVTLYKALLWLVFLSVAITTALPFIPSNEWWIRGWDFPRLHIATLAAVCCLATLWLRPAGFLWITILSLAILGYQSAKIMPYTSLYPSELALEPLHPEAETFTVTSINVLKENEDRDRIADYIKKEQPAVLLLMETDDTWRASLAEALSRYETVEYHPHKTHYGMIFATNLVVEEFAFRLLSSNDTPTATALLVAPNGARFSYIGLHPKPPIPGEDTDERDAQLLKAATIAHRLGLPVICMGDFNDVAWSRTSKHIKEKGDFLDPRVGRGFYSSFDATHPLLRFPIDQLFVTEKVKMVSFGRGPHVGSDHFPMEATVYIEPVLSQ